MTTYVTDKQINEISEAVASQFQNGSLHSNSPVREIVPYVIDELRERGLPTRRSLANVIANVAKLKWREVILQTRRLIIQSEA